MLLFAAGAALFREWSDPAALMAAGAATAGLAAVIAAHAAGSVIQGGLGAVLAVGWAALLLPLSGNPYPSIGLVTSATVDIRRLGWTAVLAGGALLFVFLLKMRHSLRPASALLRLNLLVWVWCVGGGLVLGGTMRLASDTMPLSLDGSHWAAAIVLGGLGLAGLLVRPVIRPKGFLFAYWAAYAGLVAAFIHSVLSLQLIALARGRVPLFEILSPVVLFGLASAFGLVVPTTLNLCWNQSPRCVPGLWAAFQVAAAMGLSAGRYLSPWWQIDFGGGICVLPLVVGWMQSETFYGVAVLTEEERAGGYPGISESSELSFADLLSLRTRGLVNLLLLHPLRQTVSSACDLFHGFKQTVGVAWAREVGGRHIVLHETPETEGWLCRALAAPITIPVWGVTRLFRLCRRGYRLGRRAAEIVFSVLLPRAFVKKADPDVPARWNEREYRLAVETRTNLQYQLTGELWTSGRECFCLINVQSDRWRVAKRFFVSRQYVQDHAALGRNHEEIQNMLLRAGFRTVVVNLQAGRFTSQPVDLEHKSHKSLEASRHRWCEFRTSASSLGMGGAYICDVAYPRDPCRGATTVEACSGCNVPELWERCSNLVISGTAGTHQDDRFWRSGHFSCSEQGGGILNPRQCLCKPCFVPSVVKQIIWADPGRTA
jgi:hypothetical protein